MSSLEKFVNFPGRVVVDPVRMAYLGVDIQTAFMPDHLWEGYPVGGGGLAVRDAPSMIMPAVQAALLFPAWRRYFSLDKHPPGHVGFYSSYALMVGSPHRLTPFTDLTAELVSSWDKRIVLSEYFDLEYLKYYVRHVKGGKQRVWWEHAPFGSEQALLHPAFRGMEYRMLLTKGPDPKIDSYSPFEDNLGNSTGLGEQMEEHGVKELVVTGLALDYCVGFAVLAAIARGFTVYVVLDATRWVAEETAVAMLETLHKAGARLVLSSQLVSA